MIEGEHMQEWFDSVGKKFVLAFVEGDRWKLYFKGLGVTLEIALFAAILGMVIGTVVALMRLSQKRNGKKTIWARIAGIYVVFASANVDKIFVAIIAFGLNSAAYISEVIRSGIMSVDKGQMEAGRSLGLSYSQTMRLVILPQAFKNVLPAMGNELITLLKETSISGYIGLVDLTKGSDIIRSITYDAMMPLGVVALIYLAIVVALSMGVRRLEKKLRKNEKQ